MQQLRLPLTGEGCDFPGCTNVARGKCVCRCKRVVCIRHSNGTRAIFGNDCEKTLVRVLIGIALLMVLALVLLYFLPQNEGNNDAPYDPYDPYDP